MTTPTFACPGCTATVRAGAQQCPACGLRLVGELAAQLWQLDQHLAGLYAQRTQMVAALRAGSPARAMAATDSRAAGAWTASSPAPAKPGVETRTVLLWLGATCLVAAILAGTALIWSSLGPTGQAFVMVLVTVALLGGAVRLQRLPATAEALAAVGVASLAIDLVAGRTLGLRGLSELDARSYWSLGSLLAAVALGSVAVARPRLASPTLGAALAVFGGILAVVDPRSVDAVALVGVLELVAALVLLRVVAVVRVHAPALRATCVAVGAFAVVVGAVGSLVAAADHGPGSWCGVVLAGVLLLLPELDSAHWPVEGARATAVGGGLLLAALATVGDVVPTDMHALAVVVAGGVALVVVVVAPSRPRAVQRGACALGAAASLVMAIAESLLQQRAAAHGAVVAAGLGIGVLAVVAVAVAIHVSEPARSATAVVAAVLTLVAVAQVADSHGARISAVWTAMTAAGFSIVALVIRRCADRDLVAPACEGVAVVGAVGSAIALVALSGFVVSLGAVAALLSAATFAAAALLTPDRMTLRWLACIAATVYAGVAAGAALHVHGATTPELYVATPVLMWAATGIVAMLRDRTVTSAVLLPAVIVGFAPSISLALDGDTTRQTALLAVGAVVAAVGAQWRLATPLYTGSAVVAIVVLRIAGPHVVALPRWVTLGTAGVVLLVLGATWERRLSDARRMIDLVRPRVATLR